MGAASEGNGGGCKERPITSLGGGHDKRPVASAGQMAAGENRVIHMEFEDAEVVIVASSVDIAGLHAIRGGAISSTSEPSLMIIWLMLSLYNTPLSGLGMSGVFCP